MKYKVLLKKMVAVYMETTVQVDDRLAGVEALRDAIASVDEARFPDTVQKNPEERRWSLRHSHDAAEYFRPVETKPEIIAMLADDGSAEILGARINVERLRFALRQMDQTACDSVEVRQAIRQLLDALDRL